MAHVRHAGLAVSVVVMSGQGDVRQAAAAHQADGSLAKPFDLEDLLATVARFVPDPGP